VRDFEKKKRRREAGAKGRDALMWRYGLGQPFGSIPAVPSHCTPIGGLGDLPGVSLAPEVGGKGRMRPSSA
jgi:hypothetical protein